MEASPALKECPFCKEPIRADATVCKHCGRNIPAAKPPAQPQSLADRILRVAIIGLTAAVILYFGYNAWLAFR